MSLSDELLWMLTGDLNATSKSFPSDSLSRFNSLKLEETVSELKGKILSLSKQLLAANNSTPDASQINQSSSLLAALRFPESCLSSLAGKKETLWEINEMIQVLEFISSSPSKESIEKNFNSENLVEVCKTARLIGQLQPLCKMQSTPPSWRQLIAELGKWVEELGYAKFIKATETQERKNAVAICFAFNEAVSLVSVLTNSVELPQVFEFSDPERAAGECPSISLLKEAIGAITRALKEDFPTLLKDFPTLRINCNRKLVERVVMEVVSPIFDEIVKMGRLDAQMSCIWFQSTACLVETLIERASMYSDDQTPVAQLSAWRMWKELLDSHSLWLFNQELAVIEDCLVFFERPHSRPEKISPSLLERVSKIRLNDLSPLGDRLEGGDFFDAQLLSLSALLPAFQRVDECNFSDQPIVLNWKKKVSERYHTFLLKFPSIGSDWRAVSSCYVLASKNLCLFSM